MEKRPYGPADGQTAITLADYHQSKDELAGLPQTLADKIPVTNTPNIFSYRSYIFAKNPALVPRFIKATKCSLSLLGICDDFMAEPFHRFRAPERERVPPGKNREW